MRYWAPVLLAIAVALGAVQIVSSIALRGSAEPGSWVRLVPETLALRVERIDPAFPLPAPVRLVLAQRAIDENDPARAEAELAKVPESRDRLALEGRLAQARGDAAGAVRAYLAADDLEDIELQVGALARDRNLAAALALQHATIARLEADPTQADALARAYFALGRLEETQAYAFWVGTPQRNAHEVAAGAAYARAVALAPLEERYLIAYANQLLNLDRFGDAERAFLRARDADPTSADPFAGLGELAHRRGDEQAARAYLARARSLDAHDEAVLRLARELGA
jgi:tetratricopeptide (TPR) repeat protein